MKNFKKLMQEIPAWVLTLFVVSVVMMNLLANKSIDLGLSWLALDCGIIVSWISFFTMDIITQRFGPKAAIQISFVAIAVNLFVSVCFFFGAIIKGFWGESYVENGEIINVALNNTFKGTWYVLLGSTIAFIVSSIVNNLTNSWIGKLFKKSGTFIEFICRSYVSTFIGQFIDNLTFALIVSYNFFGWSLTQCVTCALTGALAELLCETLFSRFGYKIVKKWEKERIGEEYLQMISEKNAV